MAFSDNPGINCIGLNEFGKNSIQQNELITEVVVPKIDPNSSFGHYKFNPRSKADKPTLGIAVRLDLSPKDKMCLDARVAFSNASAVPMR